MPSSPNASPEVIGEFLRSRRTVHDFTDEPIPVEIIEQGVEIARWAPNHLRTEPWRFYLLDPDKGRQIAELNAQLVHQEKGEKAAAVKLKRWSEMPGWLVVTCPRNVDTLRQTEDYAACCCAIHNLSLYLWSCGIGVKWTTGGVTREPAFFDLLALNAEREFVVGLFWYGYPASVPTQHRKDVEEILQRVPAFTSA